ncbi:hypothetical protein, partial [Xanthomonas perforans]|uniref:hypothetical protein n=1 Tax=Xanthomonas perforans TaxID=442694 RepID=UPI001F37D7CD
WGDAPIDRRPLDEIPNHVFGQPLRRVSVFAHRAADRLTCQHGTAAPRRLERADHERALPLCISKL